MEIFTDGLQMNSNSSVGIQFSNGALLDRHCIQSPTLSEYGLCKGALLDRHCIQSPTLPEYDLCKGALLEQRCFKPTLEKALVGSKVRISKSGERVLFISTGSFTFRETPVYDGPAAGFTQSWTR